mgnify:CR=1 FL=1
MMYMKKFVLKMSFSIAFVATVGFLSYNAQNKEKLSDLSLSNVEALAQGEIIVGPFCASDFRMCVAYSGGFFLTGYRQYF